MLCFLAVAFAYKEGLACCFDFIAFTSCVKPLFELVKFSLLIKEKVEIFSIMNETEEVAKRLYEACLSGSVETLNELIRADRLILDRAGSTECFFSDTPLHVAVLRGHLDFAKALLRLKPELATEVDSRRCTPLHLASTEGHIELVRELLHLHVKPDVCTTRDQDGTHVIFLSFR